MKNLQPFGAEDFARTINPIIAKTRNIPLYAAKPLMYLQSNEVVRFLEEVGEPLEGYGKKITLNTSRMAKQDLRRLVSTISQPEFNRQLARIVANNRDLHHVFAKYKRFLRSCEVLQFLREIGEVLPDRLLFNGQKNELQGVELV